MKMTQKELLLAALQRGPKTNRWLADNVCLRYGAVIYDLRHKWGYRITKKSAPGKPGLVTYTLEGVIENEH